MDCHLRCLTSSRVNEDRGRRERESSNSVGDRWYKNMEYGHQFSGHLLVAIAFLSCINSTHTHPSYSSVVVHFVLRYENCSISVCRISQGCTCRSSPRLDVNLQDCSLTKIDGAIFLKLNWCLAYCSSNVSMEAKEGLKCRLKWDFDSYCNVVEHPAIRTLMMLWSHDSQRDQRLPSSLGRTYR
jgi:hypothetical protein